MYIHRSALTHQDPLGGRGKDEEHDQNIRVEKGHISNTCKGIAMVINNAGTVTL